MLVGALEVQVRRPLLPGEVAQHRVVRRAGVEPHVDRVGDLAVATRVDAEVFAGRREPRLDAARFDHRRGLLEKRFGIRPVAGIALLATMLSFTKRWALFPPLSHNFFAFVLGMLLPTIGRELGEYGLANYTEVKTVTVKL